jgi:hypothetical protein
MKFAWLRMEIREKQSFYTMMEPSIEHYCEVKSEQILISLKHALWWEKLQVQLFHQT